MKEVEKKDTPEVSGGYAVAYVTDERGCIKPDYPQNPLPADPTIGESNVPLAGQ